MLALSDETRAALQYLIDGGYLDRRTLRPLAVVEPAPIVTLEDLIALDQALRPLMKVSTRLGWGSQGKAIALEQVIGLLREGRPPQRIATVAASVSDDNPKAFQGDDHAAFFWRKMRYTLHRPGAAEVLVERRVSLRRQRTAAVLLATRLPIVAMAAMAAIDQLVLHIHAPHPARIAAGGHLGVHPRPPDRPLPLGESFASRGLLVGAGERSLAAWLEAAARHDPASRTLAVSLTADRDGPATIRLSMPLRPADDGQPLDEDQA